MSEWIKCSERMPKVGKPVLLWRSDDECFEIGWLNQRQSAFDLEGYWEESSHWRDVGIKDVTHWMPLPSPPAQRGEGQDGGAV